MESNNDPRASLGIAMYCLRVRDAQPFHLQDFIVNKIQTHLESWPRLLSSDRLMNQTDPFHRNSKCNVRNVTV